MRNLLMFFTFMMFLSCADEVVIRQKSQLRLEYPSPIYENGELDFP